MSIITKPKPYLFTSLNAIDATETTISDLEQRVLAVYKKIRAWTGCQRIDPSVLLSSIILESLHKIQSELLSPSYSLTDLDMELGRSMNFEDEYDPAVILPDILTREQDLGIRHCRLLYQLNKCLSQLETIPNTSTSSLLSSDTARLSTKTIADSLSPLSSDTAQLSTKTIPDSLSALASGTDSTEDTSSTLIDPRRYKQRMDEANKHLKLQILAS